MGSQTVPLLAFCSCPKGIPVRTTKIAQQRMPRHRLPPDMVLLTYWCAGCKAIVELTPRKLGWS